MSQAETCCRVSVDSDLISEATHLLAHEEEKLEQNARLFALLGNEVRLKIVRLFLAYEKMCVCDLSDVLEMNQSPISQHLRKLNDGGLLKRKREGMTVFYSLSPKIKETIKSIIEG